MQNAKCSPVSETNQPSLTMEDPLLSLDPLYRLLGSILFRKPRIAWDIVSHGTYEVTLTHQPFYVSFIPSNPNTPLLLVVSSPPLTPPNGPTQDRADSHQP